MPKTRACIQWEPCTITASQALWCCRYVVLASQNYVLVSCQELHWAQPDRHFVAPCIVYTHTHTCPIWGQKSFSTRIIMVHNRLGECSASSDIKRLEYGLQAFKVLGLLPRRCKTRCWASLCASSYASFKNIADITRSIYAVVDAVEALVCHQLRKAASHEKQPAAGREPVQSLAVRQNVKREQPWLAQSAGTEATGPQCEAWHTQKCEPRPPNLSTLVPEKPASGVWDTYPPTTVAHKRQGGSAS